MTAIVATRDPQPVKSAKALSVGEQRALLRAKRRTAQVGMGAAMAVLLYTGLKGGRLAMRQHLWAGMALLGFTLWHWSLYQPQRRQDLRTRLLPADEAGDAKAGRAHEMDV